MIIVAGYSLLRCPPWSPRAARSRQLWSASGTGALHDSQHDRLHGVVLRGGVPDDAADDRHVDRLEAAAQRVNQQLLGDGPDEHVGPASSALRSADRAIDLGAVGQDAGRVDRQPFPGASSRH